MAIFRAQLETRVTESDSGLVAELPSPRRPVAVVLLGLWLAAWVVGLGFVSQQFVEGGGSGRDWVFLISWAAIWLAAGGAAAGYMAWLVAGRERITLGGGVLVIRRAVGRLGITRAYALAHVTELRTFGREVPPALALALALAGRGASGVRFRMGERVVMCARALDEPAARALVDRMRAHPSFAESRGQSAA